MKKPIIAAINGPAVGVGITLPMQWDIRVAAESARIGFVFVRRGVIPEALSTWLLPRLIGVAKANELLMTGRIITAKEALDFGIVSHVWPDAEFKQKVLGAGIGHRGQHRAGFGRDHQAPHLRAAGRAVIREGSGGGSQGIQLGGSQPDSREGVTSFIEKRKPAWKMKPSKDFPNFLPEVK